ncbi:gap junction beta-3 protein-like [Sphaerodactylus townsendi]|uniref:gap junction beta-3 protein-like n=1 Tax=Sphaerodactylus townsendi TaxID=933632 RepID=UPI0020268DF0|nr:gap junction beta-3 protein-like [Sphaerodactylus townsendi]
MGTDVLLQLFSGTTGLAPPLARAGLSILMAVRLAALAVGTRSLWRDEMGDLICNSTASCRLVCFDASFPVSPFTLFLLQAAFVSAHGLACSFLWRPPDSQGKGWLCRKTQQLRLHVLAVLARMLLEGIFLVTFHALYGHYPQLLRCPASKLCPNIVVCAIQNARWKDAFDFFMAGTSWTAVAICLTVLYPAIAEIFQLTLGPTKRQVGRSLLVECA